jgi:hypothetical protein
MSIADINTKVAEAIAANEAGDTSTALLKLRSARMLLAGLPDSTAGDTSLRWDRSSIDAMIKDLQQQQTSASVSANGIRTTRIRYKRTRSSDDDCD